jgi:hypothetical protein
MTRTSNRKGRKLIFLLVLLGHCVLIFVISRSNAGRRSGRPHEPLVVFFLNGVREKTEADKVREPAPAEPSSRLSYPSTVPVTKLPSPSIDANSSDAITDWYGQVHSVAEDAIENERKKGAKRAFEHKMPSAPQAEASIFDPPPVRRAGTWDGPDRFYITDNCAYEWDRAPRPPPTLLDNRLKTPVCKPPPKGGGGAMFKDLTPDYLRTLPEPTSR